MTPLKIEVKKRGSEYIADNVNLPGSPPIGAGKTPQEAIGALVINLASDSTYNGKYYKLEVNIKQQ